MIYIVGLGPSQKDGIKEKVKNFILNFKDGEIVLRIDEHPAVDFLRDNNIAYESCDRFYTDKENFADTYRAIADYILEKAKKIDVAYLVPGHPMVAELTSKLILEEADDVKIIGGESFLDSCFNLAKFDPIEGFSLLDATDPEAFKNINPKQHILISQCYDDIRAADISVELDRYYPFDHKVTIMEQVGCLDEKIYWSELSELSSKVGEKVNNLRTVYIPPYMDSVDTNIKNYVSEFGSVEDSSSLIASIEKTLLSMKTHLEDDEAIRKDLAKLLQNIIDFTVAEDVYVELDQVLRKMKENG
ncbi:MULTISPECIES: SAM-dependent methyltransferase [unclassified Gemella]|uniref:SAM-dependent methyltransferase n=1 Tax=unclassified Gemella TaxID=2624949 RepID=UPI001072F12D|nr:MULTISPECIES: SAM-dependent methyltransferase [unclassified Gemella]MBF0709966.1 tetrapyrrole methylase [Gemella sp. GL1.1]MBF0747337.1 tetrapyrrole methylase [Gemella sp. 19428wG2_WT2a]NYS27310.1 tetrapyrrole methylase [Gemella sp. GL1]TFU57530.1 tetrapyrrole methylase [Gemella sp. WT2a]